MGSYANVCLWRFSQGSTDSSCLSPGFLVGRTDPWDWYIYLRTCSDIYQKYRLKYQSFILWVWKKKWEKLKYSWYSCLRCLLFIWKKYLPFVSGLVFLFEDLKSCRLVLKLRDDHFNKESWLTNIKRGEMMESLPGEGGNPARYPDLQISLLLAKIVKFLAGSFEI